MRRSNGGWDDVEGGVVGVEVVEAYMSACTALLVRRRVSFDGLNQ